MLGLIVLVLLFMAAIGVTFWTAIKFIMPEFETASSKYQTYLSAVTAALGAIDIVFIAIIIGIVVNICTMANPAVLQ